MIDKLERWLDGRTGYRRIVDHLLHEPLPPGTGWAFTLGSVLLALLAVQFVSGAFLTLYYAPTPDHAYDSVQFIDSTPAGLIVRGLHHYGASFIVVVLALHMLRVILYGGYRAPREVTWISGLALLGLVLAFALTGYLLPWDQRAYWATVVTINISRLAPGLGEAVASVLRGGTSIGALTLTRWYSIHVIFLPLAAGAIVLAHVALMRRHGISGPITPRGGERVPFYPWQAARDAAVITVVLLALAALAWRGSPALDGPADPTDAAYVPRPEWYFLGLFQLLKYFPGRWEIVGAIVLPTLVGVGLALLPWLDRSRSRALASRLPILAVTAAGTVAIVTLTALGFRDRPQASRSREAWTLREIGGRSFALSAGCARCHDEASIADPLEGAGASRPPEWVGGHIADPEMIAPGLREPPATMHEREAAAILAYLGRLSRGPYPGFPARTEMAAAVYARYCIGCHVIDGEGGDDGPDLSAIGTKHDRTALRRWIADPEAVNPDAEMPSFGDRLLPGQLEAIAEYLADRQ